jgi:two-component system alkaline phosphatase synthesis response regulator PhoP
MLARVLLIEDEPEMQVILTDNLQYEGYDVVSFGTGEAGLESALRDKPDLILLDLMLPGMSGYEVCRKIRSSGSDVPIVVITARNTEMDRIAGLELGADDYVGKPFSVRELLARVRAHLRHRETLLQKQSFFKFGDLTIDIKLRLVHRGLKPLDLSSREFDLLCYFIAHRGEIVTRDQLLTDVWGYQSLPTTRTVDNFVAKLRRKIEPDPAEPSFILTIHGSGYRFMA